MYITTSKKAKGFIIVFIGSWKRDSFQANLSRIIFSLRESTASESWVQASITDSVKVQQPGNVTLNSETESTVLRGSVLALLSEPVVRLGVKTLTDISGHQLLQIRDTH